jgi:hypothetical protein
MEPRQEVVERLLTAAVLLRRKNAELEAKLAAGTGSDDGPRRPR